MKKSHIDELITIFGKEQVLTEPEDMIASSYDIDPIAAEANLFYPPDPGSVTFSTIGGNVAENAGGLRGLKYGK